MHGPHPHPKGSRLQENPVRKEVGERHWREGLNRVQEKARRVGHVPSFRGGRSSEVATMTRPEGSSSQEKRDVHIASFQ